MDIETITKQSKFIPYLICAYNGIDYITSYANESLNQKTLFNSFINQLLNFFNKDSKVIIVYAHNLSGFDGIFLLKHLLKYGKVKPLLFNGKLMSIKINLNIDGYKNKTIIFKDSYLLLPQSLRNLCVAFNINIGKGYFPFLLTNIFYKGILPNFENWTGISLSEFELLVKEYTNITWNFKEEAIKYCKLDCKCLYEILVQFNELIFNHFKVNIDIPLTLPALAMKIYKSQFMPKDKIYQLLGNIDKDIRESYTGGSVDVYIPHNRTENFFTNIFRKLYCYDVNSLYPFIMAKTPMPLNLIKFHKNMDNIKLENFFGYIKVEVFCPSNMLKPVLPFKFEGKTIYPTGNWIGIYFSEELKAVKLLGYQFKLIKGYEFSKSNIFDKYVDHFFNIKLNSNGAQKAIAKLHLNGLYGYFGRKQDLIETVNVNNNSLHNYLSTRIVKDLLKINNDYSTLLLSDNINHKVLRNLNMICESNIKSTNKIVMSNVAIAAAVTAYARIHMIPFKIDPNTLYTDTDSIFTLVKLDPSLIGDEIGQMKDELKGGIIEEKDVVCNQG